MKRYTDGKVAAKSDKDGNVQAVAHIRSSPIPSPQELMEYKEVDPDFPTTITGWASDGIKFHQKIVAREQIFGFVKSILGNIFALCTVAGLCYTGYLFLEKGHAVEGASVIVTTVVAAISIFVTQKYFPSKKEEEEN